MGGRYGQIKFLNQVFRIVKPIIHNPDGKSRTTWLFFAHKRNRDLWLVYDTIAKPHHIKFTWVKDFANNALIIALFSWLPKRQMEKDYRWMKYLKRD